MQSWPFLFAWVSNLEAPAWCMVIIRGPENKKVSDSGKWASQELTFHSQDLIFAKSDYFHSQDLTEMSSWETLRI